MQQLKNIFLASAIAMTLGLTACTHGNSQLSKENTSTIESNITRGKTTKADISKIYGEPTSTTKQGASETWIYTSNKIDGKVFIPIVGGFLAGGSGKVLEIVFNKQGIVKDYSLTTAKH